MPQIFLHYIGHGHAQSRREILRRHHLLRFLTVQQIQQSLSQSLRISRGIELHCQFFTLRHLLEISQICGNDGHAIGASKMRYTAASGR